MYSDILENIKKYRWKSVYFRYFKALFFAVFTGFIIYNIILYSYYYYSIEKEREGFAENIFIKISNNIDRAIDEANQIYEEMISNSGLNYFLDLDTVPDGGHITAKNIAPLHDEINRSITYGNINKNIFVYSFKSDYSISSRGNTDDIKNRTWFQYYMQNKKTFLMYFDKNTQNVAFVWEIEDGLLAVELEHNSLREYIYASSDDAMNGLFIADLNDTVIYSDNVDCLGEKIDFLNIDRSRLDSMETNRCVIFSQDGSLLLGMKNSNNLIYLLMTPENIGVRSVMGAGWIIVVSSILVLIILVFVSIFMTSRLYSSICEIISIFNNTQQNRGGGDNENEALYITNNIKRIINENTRIEKEMTERLKLLNKSKKIALQTQINPHFLFNTLQMANLFIIKTIKGDNEATRIISLLAELLRITLDTKEDIIPVSLEIEHVKKYIEIQNIRFKNMIKVKWDVSEEAFDCQTVRLILQPIIENSISHGMDNEDTVLNIKVSCFTDNKELNIVIKDDGVGIDDDKLKELRELMNSDQMPQNRYIGMLNVHQRVQLIFGKEYGLTINSEKNKGTSVIIKMPII